MATATQVVEPTATPTAVVWPTATPTPVIVEWRGEYFDNGALVGLAVLVRNDRVIYFDWGYNAPAAGLPADAFSARWTRTLQFAEGLYRFHAAADDGARLYLDDDLVINEWRDGNQREVTADRRLSAGKHSVRVEYYERSNIAAIQVWWEKLTTYPDWKGEYWANRELNGDPVLVRNDMSHTERGDLSFDWKKGSPDAAIPSNHFSARWTRKVDFDKGTYRFHALVDDGVRLWVDDQLIIDAWSDHDARELTTDYTLVKGTHSLEVEYYERIGNALLSVWWEKIASPSYPDWKGEYWTNRDLHGDPALVRNDQAIDFRWRAQAPSPGLPPDDFSVRWTRKAHFDAATYRFHALVDDGVRLWVDGQPLIDAWWTTYAWQTTGAHELTAEKAMVRGTHNIKVEYYEHLGDARIHVWWQKVASPTYPDWKGEYWSNRDLSGSPALIRNDRRIDFVWGDQAPSAGLPADNFAARWTRKETFQPGVYRFYAWADDGVRLYVDGTLILDKWHGSTGEVYMVDRPLSGSYRLKVEYSEHTGDARIRLWWKRMGGLPTPTPTPTATATTEPTPTATATIEPMPTIVITIEPILRLDDVRLNEILPVPGTTDWDGNGIANGRDEWVELYNAGLRAVDLSGWFLEDVGSEANGVHQSLLYRIPAATVLEPDEFLVLYRQKTGIALGDGGGEVKLINPKRKVVDSVVFGEIAPDASYSRSEDGAWYISNRPSPGWPNPFLKPIFGSPMARRKMNRR